MTDRNGTAPQAAEYPPAHRIFLGCNRGNFKPPDAGAAALLRYGP